MSLLLIFTKQLMEANVNSTKLMQKMQEEETLKSFYKASITPVSKPDIGIKKKNIHSPISYMTMVAKIFSILYKSDLIIY